MIALTEATLIYTVRGTDVSLYRSHYHSNVHLNDDSKSHRSLARDFKSRRHMYVVGRVRVTINPTEYI